VIQVDIQNQDLLVVVPVLVAIFGILLLWLVKDVKQDNIQKVEVFHVWIAQQDITH